MGGQQPLHQEHSASFAKTIHLAVWLPSVFHSGLAASLVEMLHLVNTIRGAQVITSEFLSHGARADTAQGIRFDIKQQPSRPPDILILLATAGLHAMELLRSLEHDNQHAAAVIAIAERHGARIAALCSASFFLASAGLLDGKRATTCGSLKSAIRERFPKVRWDAARTMIRDGRIYTSNASFLGLEIASALLKDCGFLEEERMVRKILVLPALRRFPAPPAMELHDISDVGPPLIDKVTALFKKNIQNITPASLAKELGLSPKTLSRRFAEDLRTTPARWIQDCRILAARELLEKTNLTVSTICYRVGYQDVGSFSRLFSKVMGVSPSEYRRQNQ